MAAKRPQARAPCWGTWSPSPPTGSKACAEHEHEEPGQENKERGTQKAGRGRAPPGRNTQTPPSLVAGAPALRLQISSRIACRGLETPQKARSCRPRLEEALRRHKGRRQAIRRT
eukprot:7832319-Alexandrium_andersonii.AAC.1